MRAIALTFLMGCIAPSATEVDAHVVSRTGASLEGATVAIACTTGDGGAARTGVDGTAVLGLFGDPDLATCTVTTSLLGFATTQQMGAAADLELVLDEVP